MGDGCHLECVVHDVRSDPKYGQRLIARALVACGRVFDPGACRASPSFPFVLVGVYACIVRDSSRHEIVCGLRLVLVL